MRLTGLLNYLLAIQCICTIYLFSMTESTSGNPLDKVHTVNLSVTAEADVFIRS